MRPSASAGPRRPWRCGICGVEVLGEQLLDHLEVHELDGVDELALAHEWGAYVTRTLTPPGGEG